MIQNRRLTSNAVELTVLWVGIGLILTPAVILSLNIQFTERFFGAKDVLSQSPIGEIIRSKKIVRRKAEDDSAYLPIRQGDPVFEGDVIVTGKESSTRVNLSDGTSLDLGSESMIRIEPVRSFSIKGLMKKMKVTIEAGGLTAKTKINSAPLVLTSSAGEVLRELAAAPTPAPAPTTAPPVSQPQSITQSTSPLITQSTTKPTTQSTAQPTSTPLALMDRFTEEVTITLNPPKANPAVSTPIPASKPAAAPVSTPASTPSLAKTSATASTPTPSLASTPTATPPPVKPVAIAANAPSLIPASLEALPEEEEKELNTSASAQEKPLMEKVVLMANKPLKKLEIITAPHIGLIADDAEISEQSFRLRWKGGGISVQPPYTVKIESKNSTVSIPTEKTEIIWPLPLEAEGQISWWVEVPLRNGGVVQSKKQTSSWKLPTPVLVSPADQDRIPEFYLRGEQHVLLLTWKEMPICKSYEVAVSRTQTFEETLLQEVTENHFVNFQVPTGGTYYWRVGCNYAVNFKLFSKPNEFNLGSFLKNL
jgi:hypothetical protein